MKAHPYPEELTSHQRLQEAHFLSVFKQDPSQAIECAIGIDRARGWFRPHLVQEDVRKAAAFVLEKAFSDCTFLVVPDETCEGLGGVAQQVGGDAIPLQLVEDALGRFCIKHHNTIRMPIVGYGNNVDGVFVEFGPIVVASASAS